jgi:glycosyltransferase involved in cell wall biosynthesis
VGPYDSNPSALNEKDLEPYIEHGLIEYFGQQDDVRSYIEMCNFLELPSYHEGNPKTVLEAMAMGRPIITTDAPRCKETVINNQNGLLVKVQDVHDLVTKMEILINDRKLILQFGEVSRKIVEGKFDVNKVYHKILEIMELV